MSHEQLKETVLEILGEHNTMSIATINSVGMPELAAVFYVNIDLKIYFLSIPTSRHGHNIGNGVKCAATIHKDYYNWQEIKGLQLEGWVAPLAVTIDKVLVLKKYSDKYNYLEKLLVEGNKIFHAFSKAKIYEFKPEIIWVTDNSYGFGQRRELVIPHSI